MRPFAELVDEAVSADVTGWRFEWLDGRASEQRPPWGYAQQLAGRLSRAHSALDIDTGGGEVLAEATYFPPQMTVTETWPPNARRARQALEPRGVTVVETTPGAPFPFPDQTFDLVSARHPVRRDWAEIHRVLTPGGSYFAQHVSGCSVFELIERFIEPPEEQRYGRDPNHESTAAQSAGLTVTEMRTARCRMEFYDVGAIIWILRKCVWWVPDFSVDRYHHQLVELDEQMRHGKPVVTYSTRHLIEARRPALA